MVYAARHEMAPTLDDVLARRTRAVLQQAHNCITAAPAVAALLRAELGWTDEERADADRHVLVRTPRKNWPRPGLADVSEMP